MVNRSRWLGGGTIAVACMLMAVVLVACNALTSEQSGTNTNPMDAVQAIDLQPRNPLPVAGSPPPQRGAGVRTYYGESVEAADVPAVPPGATPAPDAEGYQLNFEDASIATVTKVIIGDILGAGYTIDSRVQGTVTLSSGRPVPRDKLLFVLEGALRMNNAIVVEDAGHYRIIPAGDATAGGAPPADRSQPGYGVTVVPLRYVSAPTILKLLDSFALRAGSARADVGRNMVLVQGSGSERRSALQTILNFDVDWMRGQSVGVFPLQAAMPEAMIAELTKIMHIGEGEANQGLVELQPIGRLNGVLVVTKRKHLLEAAANWIRRLDRSDNSAVGVRVYRLRYGSATQIAKLLNEIFSKPAGGGGLDAPENAIAPGAGVVSTAASATGTNRPAGMQQQGTQDTGFNSRFGSFGSSSNTFGNRSTGKEITSPGAVAGDKDKDQAAGKGRQLVLGNVRIAADVPNNAVLIFANQEDYRLIQNTIQQLDRPQLQVAIHATIAEVTLNNDLRYGVQWFIKSKDVGLGGDNGSALLTRSLTQAVINRALPGASLLLGPESDPRAILDALRNVTDVKVLSNPSVVVMDNQAATLQVGDQVPISTQSATILTNPNTPLVNTIDYRDTGIILQVMPRVNANGNVILDISQEISDVVQNANSSTLTPTIAQRKIRSSITVASGQSVLLAGLISERQERGRAGLPVISEIPVIGDAASQNTRTMKRTELIMFIQPQIIRDGIDAYKVAEELRAKLRGSREAWFPPGPELKR